MYLTRFCLISLFAIVSLCQAEPSHENSPVPVRRRAPVPPEAKVEKTYVTVEKKGIGKFSLILTKNPQGKYDVSIHALEVAKEGDKLSVYMVNDPGNSKGWDDDAAARSFTVKKDGTVKLGVVDATDIETLTHIGVVPFDESRKIAPTLAELKEQGATGKTPIPSSLAERVKDFRAKAKLED